jgi:hypothetical protein
MLGQKQTGVPNDECIKNELNAAIWSSDDLGDHMFGPIISTDVAAQLLEEFHKEGMVKLHKHQRLGLKEIHTGSADAAHTIEVAHRSALAHGCKRKGIPQQASPNKPKPWKWTWVSYPTDGVVEKDIVNFFNQLVDVAVSFGCLHEPEPRQVQRCFTVSHDPLCTIPLPYGPDRVDMRPDILVLPVNAFDKMEPNLAGEVASQSTGEVQPQPAKYQPKEEWLNFRVTKLVGECKATNYNAGVIQAE